MAGEFDFDPDLLDDFQASEFSAEVPLSEPEPEGFSSPPEVELLNDVTQHYLNAIGAKPLLSPAVPLASLQKTMTPPPASASGGPCS
mgnify:CR=1 FL=1